MTGAVGGPSGDVPPTVDIAEPGKMADAIDMEMESVSAKMKALEEEEKLSEKSNELHAMKLPLKKKEQTLSPVKAELKSSEIKIHPSSVKPSIKSDDAIDVSTLRNDKKLRKSVQKELRSLGLKVVDLNSDTSSSSVDSSSTSDSDSDSDISDSMHTCKSSKKKK